jgi:predicted DNA-binding transcriptional regulator YafY
MDIIQTIREGGRTLTTVEIQYIDSKRQTTIRETEPYEIKEGKYWGYCYVRGKIRQFKLENIISASLTGRKYSPRFPVKL